MTATAPQPLSVLVTGATGPSGRAVARRFSAYGSRLALNGPAPVRLPGVIGYWVAFLSAWVFLRRRMSAAYAWCAVAVMPLPGPFYFAPKDGHTGWCLDSAG